MQMAPSKSHDWVWFLLLVFGFEESGASFVFNQSQNAVKQNKGKHEFLSTPSKRAL